MCSQQNLAWAASCLLAMSLHNVAYARRDQPITLPTVATTEHHDHGYATAAKMLNHETVALENIVGRECEPGESVLDEDIGARIVDAECDPFGSRNRVEKCRQVLLENGEILRATT